MIKFKQLMISVTMFGSLVLVAPTSWAYDEQDFCSQTTQAAFKSCRYEVKDDFYEAKGNCINISDDEQRYECFIDAWTEIYEAKGLCYEQREARNAVCEAIGEERYDPQIAPANFVNPLEIGTSVAANTYMPLVPGLTKIFESGDETITVVVTGETVEIQGVTCIVVRDTAVEEGEVIEDTDDWYAQDVYGNVWYFGELSRNFEEGQLTDLEGSWKAGVEGAKAGILMQAAPEVGAVYRQEWALSEAEDMGEVLSTAATESSPAASCNGDCVQTRDFTPIEPDTNENKFHAPGIGVIVAYDVETPDEREALVEYHY